MAVWTRAEQEPDWLDLRGAAVLDVLFVALGATFFLVSIGYVVLCDRLMK